MVEEQVSGVLGINVTCGVLDLNVASRVPGTSMASGRSGNYCRSGPRYGDKARGHCWRSWSGSKECFWSVGRVLPAVLDISMVEQ